MAQINLGIDVDSTSVDPASAKMQRLKRSVSEASAEMARAGQASGGTANGLRGVGAAAGASGPKVGAFNQAMASAADGAQRTQAAFVGLRTGIAAVAAIAGGSVVSSLVSTTLQLERVEMTLQQVAGSTQAAEREFAYIRETADRLGQSYLSSAQSYAKLLAAANAGNISLESTRQLFEGVSAAATVFGLSSYEAEGALNAVQQMISKGTVAAEELRGQLGERLPGAFAIAAESMGMTTAELNKALEDGKVGAAQFVDAFGAELQERFGAAAQSSDTAARSIAEFNNAVTDLKIGLIEGGFLDALKAVMNMMTEFARHPMVKGTGAELRWLADRFGEAAQAIGVLERELAEFGNKVKAQFSADVAALVATVRGLPDQARAALGGFVETLRQIGRDAMAGLIAGFTERFESLRASIAEIGSSVAQRLRDAWDVQSPSRVFAEIGHNAMLGLDVGFDQGRAQLQLTVEQISSSLAASMSSGLSTMMGGDFKGGLTGIVGGISAAIGEEFRGAIDDFAQQAADGIAGMAGKQSLMDPVTFSAVGQGLGNAAVGALEGNAQQIGAGIGQAAGSAIGSLFGPMGTVIGGALGGAAGGFLGKMFGGDGVKRDRVSGTVFAGTAYAQEASSRKFSQEEGKTGSLSLVQEGLKALLSDFDAALSDTVRGITASRRVVDDLRVGVKDVEAAREMIAGTLSDTIYAKGGKTDELAAEIERRTAAFMDLAAGVATAGHLAATEAQVAFRQVQEDFSAANVAMLKAVGFSAAKINAARKTMQGQLVDAFEDELLGTLADTGRATRAELERWRDAELANLTERRRAALLTAREIGADVSLVMATFKAQSLDIREEYRDMLGEMVKDTGDAAERMDRLRARLEASQSRLSRIEQQRSGVLAELERRSASMRAAEESLSSARAAIARSSELTPGGPMSQFAALQGQFRQAVNAARGGDQGAAQSAAGLAQELLTAGRGVYASGAGYADLFKAVNRDLLGAQTSLAGRASEVESRLDKETFADVTERSTTALLRALGTLSSNMKEVKLEIRAQNQAIARAEMKRRTA